MSTDRNAVSFQSREKRRKYKRAVAKTKRVRWDETARRWFLTLARKDCRCACCGQQLERKAEVVYRHEPREVRCVRCAGQLEDSKAYRPSIRWERARARERHQQLTV
jgi:hypothetical protein